ncbi:MAG: hypothetical protein OXF41_04060 [bacterium]|nr:hypothetical protein [bacterium]
MAHTDYMMDGEHLQVGALIEALQQVAQDHGEETPIRIGVPTTPPVEYVAGPAAIAHNGCLYLLAEPAQPPDLPEPIRLKLGW